MLALLYPLCYNASGVPSVLRKGAAVIARLAEVRRERGLTQEQLALASGVHRVTIARFERDRVSPTLETLERLADALDVTIDALVDKKGA